MYLSTFSHFYAVYVPESSPTDTYIAYVKAKDPDLGINGQVTISLIPVTEGSENLFILKKGLHPVLATTGKLDAENKSKYELRLKACDRGIHPQLVHFIRIKGYCLE